MLKEKRGSDFNTQHSTGPATVNVNLLAEFIAGRDLIINAKCTEAEPIIDNIITQMSIPLIQGTLKYAYSSDPASGSYCASDAGKTAMSASDDCVKAWAEAGPSPRPFSRKIKRSDASSGAAAATTIKTNLDITATEPVKRRLRGGFGGDGVDVHVPGHHGGRRRQITAQGHPGPGVRLRHGPRARARRGRRGRGRGAPPLSLRTPVPTKFPAPSTGT